MISKEGPGFALVAKDHLAEIVTEDGKKRIDYKFDLTKDFPSEVKVKNLPNDADCKDGFPVKFKVTQTKLTSLSPGRATWAKEKEANQHNTFYVEVEVTVGAAKEYVLISLTELKAIIDSITALHELKYTVTKIQFKDRTAAGTYDELQFIATKKTGNVIKTYKGYLSSEEANASHSRNGLSDYLKDRMGEVP